MCFFLEISFTLQKDLYLNQLHDTLLFMKTFFILLLLCSFGAISYSQQLVSATYMNTSTVASLSLFQQMSPDYDVDYYKIVYTTKDVLGNNTIASGGLAVPKNTPCVQLPLAVYQHGTSLNKGNVPSRNNYESIITKLCSSKGFVTCAPDYLGMGDSPGLHPYVHGETEATAAIDMVRAVRAFMSDSLGLTDNGQMVVTGYSQGGHAAMAVHKYVEENNLLTEFNIVASAPASGPYDMSGSQSEVLLSNAPYTNPGYIVYMLASYQSVYGNLYTSYSDVLKSPYDTVVVPYFDGNNYTYSMGNLNPLLPTQLSDLIEDSVLQNFNSNPQHPLRVALADNDNYNWVPSRPIRMHYCTQDEQVDYHNALVADTFMTDHGAIDVSTANSGSLDHGGCVLPALTSAFQWMSSKVSSCAVLNVDEMQSIAFSIYPNPANQLVELTNLESGACLKVFSGTGKLVYSEGITGNRLSLNTASWLPGFYLVQVQKTDGSIDVEKLSIKH